MLSHWPKVTSLLANGISQHTEGTPTVCVVMLLCAFLCACVLCVFVCLCVFVHVRLCKFVDENILMLTDTCLCVFASSYEYEYV